MIIKENNVEFLIEGGNLKTASVKSLNSTDYKIDFEFIGEVVPEKTTVKFQRPVQGVHSSFTPDAFVTKNIKPQWTPTKFTSSISKNAPIFSIYDKGNINLLLVYLSDYKTPIDISFGVIEYDLEMEVTLEFFSSICAKRSSYSVILTISDEKIPFYKAIQKGADSWYKSMPQKVIPKESFNSVYSTWYNFHQNITQEGLLKECKLAKELGLDTIIVDDGWQTDDNSGGYAYCGDWKIAKSKIPDINAFVKGVHDIGMKVVFWFSVPYIGEYSQICKEFEGKFLYKTQNKAYVLDPRYPDVRNFLVNLYVNALNEWDLDGFKLDFIDSFFLKETSTIYNENMDITSVEDAVFELISTIKQQLTLIKPNVMIEFRQLYIGPLMANFGNMLRVRDCPLDNVLNRDAGINIKLTSGGTPVHSDMIIWDKTESVEDVAIRLYSVAFIVPQISVIIEKLPKEQLEVLKFFIKTTKNYQELLFSSDYIPYYSDGNISLMESYLDNKKAVVLYNDKAFNTSNKQEIICFNATGFEEAFIDCLDSVYNLTVYNPKGEIIKTNKISGLVKLNNVKSCVFILNKV